MNEGASGRKSGNSYTKFLDGVGFDIMTDVLVQSLEALENIDLHAKIEPTLYARLFLDVLFEAGIESQSILKGTDLTPSQLADSTNTISLTQQIQIYSNIGRLKDHTRLSLLHGSRIRPHHHGVWGYAVQSASTVRESLTTFNTFFNVIGPIANLALIEQNDTVRWIAVNILASGSARQVAIEEMLSGNFALLSHVTNGRFQLQELWLDYELDAKTQQYEQMFGCPVRGNMGSVEMRFDPEMLEVPLIYADKKTEAECIDWCRKRISQIDATTGVSGATRRLIQERISENVTLDEIASRMGFSPRTFRRNLECEGTSFMRIRDEVRQTIAVQYLRNTKISIDEIGFFLGYSETSNFRQAFKKWTGTPPATYRKLHGETRVRRKFLVDDKSLFRS
jgi:AraC-like DNA-binding protein